MAFTTFLIKKDAPTLNTNYIYMSVNSENQLPNLPQYNWLNRSVVEYQKSVGDCLSLDLLRPTVIFSSNVIREIFFTDNTNFFDKPTNPFQQSDWNTDFIFYTRTPVNGDQALILGPQLVKWREQLVVVENTGRVGGDGYMQIGRAMDLYDLKLDDIVEMTSSDGNINYLSLLYYLATDINDSRQVQRVNINQSITITTATGDAYVLHMTPDFYFFTSFVPYQGQTFSDSDNRVPFPSIVNNSCIQWEVVPVINAQTKKTKTKGIPLVREMATGIISLAVNGQMIIASTLSNILYYNLTTRVEDDGSILPILQESRAVALEDNPASNGNIIMAGNNLHFITADNEHKAIITSQKFSLSTVSQPVLPKSPLVPKVLYTVDDVVRTLTPPMQVKFLKIAGERFVSIGPYLLCNIQNFVDDPTQCSYSYLRSSENVHYSGTAGSGTSILTMTYPKRITATSSDGLMIALENKLLTFPQEYDPYIEVTPTNLDPFEPSLIVLKSEYFVGRNQNVVIEEMLITVKVTQITSAFSFGYLIVKDSGDASFLVDKYMSEDTWAGQIETYSAYSSSSNVSITIPVRVGQSLQGAILVLRFGSSPALAVGKCELQSIIFKNRS